MKKCWTDMTVARIFLYTAIFSWIGEKLPIGCNELGLALQKGFVE
jgi:hypothetical protein